ncbi:hypothetical protein [Lentibacillus halodurans]|nr:hypothetical protein [Lentibacillus halodurans]
MMVGFRIEGCIVGLETGFSGGSLLSHERRQMIALTTLKPT